MTKTRAPLTFDNALTRIAALIGYDAMARLVNHAERTVRNWSDPDTGQKCSIDDSLALDLGFRAAGGEGAPMFETYALLLDQADALRFADQAALSRLACTMIREDAEAQAAVVRTTMPGASAADRAEALRQVEESIAATKAVIPLLTSPPSVQPPSAQPP